MSDPHDGTTGQVWPHKHVWGLRTRGFGLLPKNNTPEEVGYTGYTAKCECGKVMFFSDDKRLSPVEIKE